MRPNIVLLLTAALASAPLQAQGSRPPMIPAEVAMRDMTPEEADAHRVWSFRAALNVAALQCQFSPYLMTVRNYNDGIHHHARELDRARVTLTNHFKRLDGTKLAQKSFDQYTTRTYNSFSTLDAQIGFCDKAADVGRLTLAAPKGSLKTVAAEQLPLVRASLTPQADPLTRVEMGWVIVEPLVNPCLDRRGRWKKRC